VTPTSSVERVSIVVRTKNRPTLLARALDDILEQSFGSWRVVVVNDGGDVDLVDNVVEARSGRFAGRIDVIHTPQSQGMETASNLALADTTAEFVAIHDDDDTWAVDFLTATVAELDGSPELVGVAVATEIVFERIEDDHFVEVERRPFGPPDDVVTVFDLLLSNRFVPISLLARRSAIEAIGGFDPSLPVVGDWEMHLRLAVHGFISYLSEKPRAFWHQRPAAEGDLANSVNHVRALHSRYDKLVRERELRAHIREHGMGELLYIAKHVQQEVQAAEVRLLDAQYRIAEDTRAREQELLEKIDRIVHKHVQYHSVAATVRRVAKRLSPFRSHRS
jgi:glycosyltransferase involved in cell wall biosynthesis